MKKALLFLALFYMSLASYGSLGESCAEAILLDHSSPVTYSSNDTKGELWYRFDAHTTYLHFDIFEHVQSPEISLYTGSCTALTEIVKVSSPSLSYNALNTQTTYFIKVKGSPDSGELAVALANIYPSNPSLDSVCEPLSPCNLIANGDYSNNSCTYNESYGAFQSGKVFGWTAYRGTPDIINANTDPVARFWCSDHPLYAPKGESIATCTDLQQDELYVISLDYNRIYYGTNPQGPANLYIDLGDDGLTAGQQIGNYYYTGIPATQNIVDISNIVSPSLTMYHHSQLFIPNTDKTKLLAYGKTTESQAQNLLLDNVKITPIIYDDITACGQDFVTIVQPCASEIDAIANISYQWVSSIPGAIVSGANTLTPTIATAGTPQLTLQVTIGNGPTMSTSFTVYGDIELNPVITPASCSPGNDGSIIPNISGGAQPYTITWEDVPFSYPGNYYNLAPNHYTIRVIDANGCEFKETYTVLSENLSVTESSTASYPNQHCGIATAHANNGSGNYTYQWAPGTHPNAETISNLLSGTYSYTVTDNVSGCTTSGSILVSEYGGSTLPTEDVLICGPNTATLTVPSGYSSYLWSTSATTQSITVNSSGTYTCTMTTAQGCELTKTFNVTKSIINMNVIADHICYGEASNSGSISTMAGGTSWPFNYYGTGLPYSSNGIWNNVSAGTYTVTITDNVGCTASQQVTVLNSPQITITTNSIVCGNADISVSGGIPAYTYDWQGLGANSGFTATTQDLSNANAGDYEVVVTDQAGCTEDHRVRLKSMEVSTQVTNVECASNAINNFSYGSITITNIQEASSPFSYQWSTSASGVTSINNLQAGTYGLTVTEGSGCVVEQVFTITQPADVTQNFISTDLLCNGDQSGSYEVASSMVSGGTSPYSIYSHTGVLANPAGQVFGNLAAGSYTGGIKTNNGTCSYTYTMNIHEPSPLAVIVNCDMTGLNQITLSANISGGTTPYSYTWGWHDNFMGYMVNNQNAVVNNVNQVGLVSLTVADDNGCTVGWEADPNNIRCRMSYRTARMAQTNNDVEAMVYPNPANDLLYVTLTDTDVEIQSATILNSLGQIVAQPTEIEHGMDISSLKVGMYLLQIQTQNGTYTKQFIKE